MKYARAFITGSRAYGKPRHSMDMTTGEDKSDIDLVVIVSEEDFRALYEQADSNNGNAYDRDSKMKSGSLRFGNLNLICETRDGKFHDWKRGTKALKQLRDKRKSPVIRQDAKALFKRLEDDYFNSLKWIKKLVRAKAQEANAIAGRVMNAIAWALKEVKVYR